MVNYVAQILIAIATYAILAGSLNLILGYAGIFSLVHAAFFGIGAYTTGQLVLKLGLPFPLDLLASFAVAALCAALVYQPLARLNHEYVIVGTLALQLVLSNVFLNWKPVTGGSYGVFGITRPSVAGIVLTSLVGYAGFAVGIAAICFAVLFAIVQSPFGLALKGLREDELLAQSFGKDVQRQRVIAFALGSGLAGVAGMLYARFVGYIDPSSFAIDQSLAAVTVLVIGGLGNLWGTLAGAAILETIPQLLRFIPATSQAVPQLQLLFYGALLTVLIRLRPQGLIGERPLLLSNARKLAARSKSSTAALPEQPPRALDLPVEPQSQASVESDQPPNPILQVQDLSRSFGGLRAVDHLSVTIPSGLVTGIIGPNGSGKTTLFNMLTGYLAPDSGSVIYQGRELTRLRPFQIARLGISRSFQDVRVFSRMTALENVVLAIQPSEIEGLGTLAVASRRQRPARARAMEVLEQFGLLAHADEQVAQLSYAQQKLLVIATLVARDDPFVLLDELAAGLDQESIEQFATLVRQMARGGHTVCLIEHNLDFVWRTADHVLVLDQGRLLAEGSPERIRQDDRVAEVYFGGVQAASHA